MPLGAELAAQDAEEPHELPPIEVIVEPERKPAKPKAGTSKPAANASSTTATRATPVVNAQGTGTGSGTDGRSDSTQGGGEGSGPGLNLTMPDAVGSRLGMTPLETPASVEVIPGQTIKQRGQTSVNQAVTQDATGFTSTAAPGNGNTGLATRGFAGHGSVMQLYDGTRLYVGSGTVTFPFDTWSAERIEVLRGPASVLYGEGAIGGVVNFVPKKPTSFFTHEGEVAAGTDGSGRFGVGSGGPISDKAWYRLDASGLASDGWLDQEGDFDSIAFSGALTFNPTHDLKLTISHDYADRSPLRYWGTPLINGAILDRLRDTNFNVRDSDVNYIDNWTQFRTEWTPTDWIELRNIAYRLTTNRHWHNVESYIYQDSGPHAGLVSRTDYIHILHDQEQIGNRFDATFRTGLWGQTKNELLVGFDVNQIDFLNRSNSPYAGQSFVDPFGVVPGLFINVAPTLPRVDTNTSQHAFFAEDRLVLTDKLSVIGGIRFDEATLDRSDPLTGEHFTKDFSNFTWRTGVVYTPVSDLAFYGQYATAVDPLGGALISMNLTNSQYELATGRQIEVGAKRSFWNGLGDWTLAFYDIEKSNLLSRDPDNSQIVRQIGAQSSRGVEFTLGVQLTDKVRYDGNIALLQAQYDEFTTVAGGVVVDYSGNRPANVPEQVINNWVTWSFLPRWEAYAGVQWIGTIYNDDANLVKRPPSTVVNFGLIYDVTERSELAFRVFNAFDEKYATGGGAYEWQLAPPRTAELSYRIKY
jgi:iron complex outermembrane recepter protein